MELKLMMMATIADAAYERGQQIVIEKLRKMGQMDAVYQLNNLSY